MAEAYLNTGATSLASGNWSDTTGFADNAELVIRDSVGNGQAITAALDQSGLSTGIEFLDIRPGASGTIGSDTGPLKVDADATADARIRNRGNFTLFVNAGGASGVVNNYDFGPGSTNWLVGGTFTNVTTDGGIAVVGESAVVTNLFAAGGAGTVEYNATAITKAVVTKGNWTIRRRVNTLIVLDGASVVYAPDDQVTTFTGDKIEVHGGRLTQTRGAVPTYDLNGGMWDLSRATEPFTPGGTSIVALGTRIVEGAGLVDLSNVTFPGALLRTVSGTGTTQGGLQSA